MRDPAPAPSLQRTPHPHHLSGVIVPLVTPFTPDGAVDERSFAALAEWLLAEGVHGFVLAGTTGESPTVRWPEIERLLALARAVVRGRVPVLVGTGTYDTAESVERTERARALGADAAFAVVPYYSRPAPAGVIEHFRRIAAVGLPTVAYHIPYRTGLTLTPATLRELLAIPGIVGLKESGGLHNVAALAGGPGAILCGEDALFLGALEAGARGGVLAAAQVAPRAFLEIHRAFTAGRPLAARVAAARVQPLIEALFAESNPAPVKWALAHQGRIASPTLRLPMVGISEPLAQRLSSLLAGPRLGAAAGAPAPAAAHPGDEELDRLRARFTAQQIPAAEWTHATHLRVGAIHVFALGPDEALTRLRAGILRLNRSHGTPETPTRGYHETITRAYVELLALFLDRFPPATPLAPRIDALMKSPLAHRDALFTFYDRARLLSPEARAAWTAPDHPLDPDAL